MRTTRDEERRSTRTMVARLRRYYPLYLLFLPVLAYYLVFAYAPMAGTLIAFKDYTFTGGIFGSPWAGLKHFERFVLSGDFWHVFKNTIVLSVYRILVGFTAPVLFAILVNELPFRRMKGFIQTASYLPHFISWVVVYGLLFNLFSFNGFVNRFLELFGREPVQFLGLPRYFRALFVGSGTWKEIGWSAIVYLAALSTVDVQLFDSAMIDGANRFQRVWHITLPSVRSVISIMFILSLGNILNVGFEQVLVMMNPAVSPVAEVLDYYVYRVGLLQVGSFSYATAVGLFRAIVALAIVLLTNRGARMIESEGAIW